MTIDALPVGLNAVLVTSDLQGIERSAPGCVPRLLGHVLADELALFTAVEERLPSADTIGVILAGDMYARPELDRRGGSGDVRSLWRAFGDQFSWAAGVAGNHDKFGSSKAEFTTFQASSELHFLDGETRAIGGLSIGGVSGIIGNPRRPFRRSEGDFVAAVRRLVAAKPDVVVLHQGPDLLSDGSLGSPAVRLALLGWDGLVIFGHCHWPELQAGLQHEPQLLNVDARAVLLMRADSGGEPGCSKA